MSKILRLAAVCLLLTFGASAECGDSSQHRREILIKLEAGKIEAAGIETEPLVREPALTELVVPGVAAIPPQQVRTVASAAAGLIESFAVAANEEVREGDVIARLRSPELIEAERAFLEAAAQQDLAEEKLRRDEKMYAERLIPERRLMTTRAETILARASFDERQQLLALHGMSAPDIAALRRERKMSGSLVITSPLSGVVVRLQATVGERVQSSAPLATVARLDPIWVELQVPAARAMILDESAHVALPAYGRTGKIVRIGRSVDPATQSVTATAEFQGVDGKVRPGLAVQATISVERSGAPQWRAPATALVHHEGRDWIFLRAPDGFRAIAVDVVGESAAGLSLRAEAGDGGAVVSRGALVLLGQLAAAGK